MTADNAQVAEYILAHDSGPLIVQYLSQNPLELEKVASMSPVNASVYIATNVVEKAVGLKPQQTAAPKPVDTLESKGATPAEHPALKGAVFK